MSLQAWNDETKISFHDSIERIVSRPSFCPETRRHGRGKKKKNATRNRWTLERSSRRLIGARLLKYLLGVRSEPVTWGIRAIPVLPADLAPSWNYAQEFEENRRRRERERRAGRGHDGRRFYHPVEFIKKIRCSRRQHLIRRHAQRHGMILLDLSSFILSLSLSPSHFQRFIPQRSFSSLIDSPVSHPLSFRTDSTEGGTNSRVFLARVILAIFARGRAVLFERAVSSTRKKKKNRRITFDRERKREREKYTRTHTHKIETRLSSGQSVLHDQTAFRHYRLPKIACKRNFARFYIAIRGTRHSKVLQKRDQFIG